MSSLNLGTVQPSFMIIGVQKGGTSSLYHYLSQHPQIIAPKEKELHYFDTLFPTPAAPYLKMFPKSYFTKKISFDATPRYIYYPGTAKKIYDFNPAMKFIIVLRDPVKRAFSAWNMYKQMKQNKELLVKFNNHEKENEREQLFSFLYEKAEFPTFEACIETELSKTFDDSIIEPSIIKRGYYKEQIEEYFKYFSPNAFLFLDFDDFKKDVKTSLDQITHFIGVKDLKSIDLAPKNVRSYNEKLPDPLYQKLKLHYQDKNKGIEKMINLPLKWMH